MCVVLTAGVAGRRLGGLRVIAFRRLVGFEAGKGQEVGEYLVTHFRCDTFRVELDAVDRVLLVGEAHYHAIAGRCCDMQTIGAAFQVRRRGNGSA